MHTVEKYFSFRKYFMLFISKKCLLLSIVLPLHACSAETINKIHLKPQFQQSTTLLDEFRPLTVFELRNIDKKPYLYELSGLAWDYDNKVLYAVTDGGYLLVLKPEFQEQQLTRLTIEEYYPLKNAAGEKISGASADSEGIALRNHNNNQLNDTELLISFERQPRVDLYNTKGIFLDTVVQFDEQHPNLKFASSNKQLEAITEWQDQYIFGSERPLTRDTSGEISLFNPESRIGAFKLTDKEHGALVGLTTLPNNTIVALERVFVNIFTPLRFHLHEIVITEETIEQTTLHSATKKYDYIYDNFEALTHHKDNYFFMVSDDNANPYQRTLLIYFQLLNVK